MVALLTVIVAVQLLQTLLFSSSLLPGLLWVALVAALSASALLGSKRVATVLRYLFYVMAAAPLVILLTSPVSAVFVIRSIVVACLLIATARYMGRSGEVAKFYANGSSSPANGG